MAPPNSTGMTAGSIVKTLTDNERVVLRTPTVEGSRVRTTGTDHGPTVGTPRRSIFVPVASVTLTIA